MTALPEDFNSQPAQELVKAQEETAPKGDAPAKAAQDEAIPDSTENNAEEKPRESVMAHFRASIEKNRRLYELLANGP